ncbi:hypothetical protein [Fodinibius sp. Rm-B-1B1-1]|uniref:hypothetical protein n=1 Tax=Fodinibius alkaliphilus TaxID=3140241 RepID=UPI00315ACEB7
MNMGLITSYIIGGILLIGILALNMSVSQSSTALTLTQTTREKAKGVQEILTHDIQKMGYNKGGKTATILEVAESDKIQFQSNIDDTDANPNSDVERITWEFTDTSLDNGNPNTFVLMRTVEHLDTGDIEQTPIRLGVANFEIRYFDEYGKKISEYMATPLSSSERSDVRQLYIKLELQSSGKVYQNTSGNGRYVRTIWEKRFSPPNLENI